MTFLGVALCMALGLGGGVTAEETIVDTPTSEVTEVSEPVSEEAPSEPTSSEEKTSEPATEEKTSEPTTTEPEEKGDVADPESTFDWKAWAQEWLSPQVLTTVTAVLTALVAVLRMVASLKSMAKSKQLTIEGVNDIVVSNLKSCVSKEVADKIDAYMPEIVAYEKKSNEIMIAFSKILALAQENTPEARKAILEVIQELGILNEKTVDSAKKTIEKQEEAKKAEEQKNTDDINKVIAETSKPKDDGTTI